ncbi:uncharacterized protein [Epargyreus clarus]|uniref:uncharacterized protein n=1 Tax=Epargyreus clarus TaxID=520877 RepID=UPI003C2FE1C4
MDANIRNEEINIRKIEDIIDIQKANGNINVRQVAFNLPSKADSTISASLAKSLETGLSKVKSERTKMKSKKTRSKRRKCSLPDITSWPSDSDITVLRMKLFLTNDVKKKVGTVVPGDGLHQQDSSSMVNLATLILKSQPPSKHSLNLEEYLLPLTSWENAVECETKDVQVNDEPSDYLKFQTECQVFDATCSHHGTERFNSDSEMNDVVTTKSKVARFLRLYFCPCCTCLYKMEQLRDENSAYCTKK